MSIARYLEIAECHARRREQLRLKRTLDARFNPAELAELRRQIDDLRRPIVEAEEHRFRARMRQLEQLLESP